MSKLNLVKEKRKWWGYPKVLFALVLSGLLLTGCAQLAQDTQNPEEQLGAGYTPVTGYVSKTTSYVSPTATTIPVVSTKDPSGQQIQLANISSSTVVKVYMNLEPGTPNQEPIMCTGLTASSWINCTRGLPFQGASETGSSTLQKAHNAGSAIIITNIGQSYNQFISLDGDQTVNGIKNFTQFPTFNTSTQSPVSDGQFATKYYVDQVGAGGFTCANVSSTLGLQCTGSAPEKVGINASSTTGMAFDSAGRLYQKIDSTLYYINSFLSVNTSTLLSQLTSLTPAANRIPISNATGTISDAWIGLGTKFGGDGYDGDLNLTSGTSTIDASNAAIVVKRYKSINISAGAVLTMSNPSSTGSILWLKSQGACNIAGTINLVGMGALGGSSVNANNSSIAVATNGQDGTVGNFSVDVDSSGTKNGKGGLGATGGSGGASGGSGGGSFFASAASASAGTASGAALGATTTYSQTENLLTLYRRVLFHVASGGGSGAAYAQGNGGDPGISNSGAGGRGGGTLIIECIGDVTFTGTLNLAGAPGSNGSTTGSSGSARASAAGGGGGGGGVNVWLYNGSINSFLGTITLTGGAPGTTASFGITPVAGNGTTGGIGTSFLLKNYVLY